jgi:hypothetical protein
MKPYELNWDLIQGDGQMKAFCDAYLLHEVSPHVHVYGRPGRDDKIDAAFSGSYGEHTGEWRFQYKYRSNLSDLFGSMKKEVEEIKKIILGEKGEQAKKHWEGVSHYVLMTNQVINPNDEAKLLQIIQLEGVKVHIWHGGYLTAKSRSHPYVILSLQGAIQPLFVPVFDKALQLTKEGPLGDFYQKIPWGGREDQISECVGSFLTASGSNCILLIGAGGTGKTRFLLETARRVFESKGHPYDHNRIVFGESVDANLRDHIGELDPTKNYLILMDEAQDCGYLREILKLAQTDPVWAGRLKFVIACRPAFQAHIESIINLTLPQDQIKKIELSPENTTAEHILRSLGYSDPGIGTIRRVAGDVPMWCVLSHYALQAGVPFQELTKARIVEVFVQKYVQEATAIGLEKAQPILEAISALQPYRVTDGELIRATATFLNQSEDELRRHIDGLEQTGFVIRRGGLIRITPDVIADYILGRALFTIRGEPTGLHNRLFEAFAQREPEHLITNLAKAEYIRGGTCLDPLCDHFKQKLKHCDNFERIRILDISAGLAYFRPKDFLDFVEIILANPQKESRKELPFGTETWPVTEAHEDVIRSVPLKFRGVGYHLEYLPRLLDLFRRIHEIIPERTNTGSDPIQIFEEVVGYGRYKPLDFQKVTLNTLRTWWSERQRLGDSAPAPWKALLFAGLEQILKIEFRETEAEGHTITVHRGQLNPVDRVMQLRWDGLQLVKKIIEEGDREDKTRSFQILREAISECLRTLPRENLPEGSPLPPVYQKRGLQGPKAIRAEGPFGKELKKNLNYLEDILKREDSLRILDEADKCIEWLADFDAGPLGERCRKMRESVFQRLPRYRLYRRLFANHNRDEELTNEEACNLIDSYGPEGFIDLLDMLFAEVPPGYNCAPLRRATHQIGTARAKAGLRLLSIMEERSMDHEHYRPVLAALIAGVRRSNPEEGRKIVDRFTKESQWKQCVIADAYGFFRSGDHQDSPLSEEERTVLLGLAGSGDDQVKRTLVSRLMFIGDPELSLLLSILRKASKKASPALIALILDTLGQIMYKTVTPTVCSAAYGILEEWIEVNDFGKIGHGTEYHLQEVLSRIAEWDLSKVLEWFKSRIAYGKKNPNINYQAVPFSLEHFSPLVKPDHPKYLEALRFVRELVIDPDWSTNDVADLFHVMAGPQTLSPGGEEVLREWLNPPLTQEKLIAIAKILHGFDMDEKMAILLGDVLVAAKSVGKECFEEVESGLSISVGSYSWSGKPGEIPPELAKRKELFHRMMERFQSVPEIAQFFSDEIKCIEKEIEDKLRRDEEFDF